MLVLGPPYTLAALSSIGQEAQPVLPLSKPGLLIDWACVPLADEEAMTTKAALTVVTAKRLKGERMASARIGGINHVRLGAKVRALMVFGRGAADLSPMNIRLALPLAAFLATPALFAQGGTTTPEPVHIEERMGAEQTITVNPMRVMNLATLMRMR